jgi:hypothetical protein
MKEGSDKIFIYIAIKQASYRKKGGFKLEVNLTSIHTVWIANLIGLQVENYAFFFIYSGKLLKGSSAQGEIINYLGGCRKHLAGVAR